MIKIEKILFPTDFSEHSKYAFSYALSFAKEYGAKLYLLHVIEDAQYLANAYMFDVPIMPSFTDVEQSRLKELQEFIDREVTDPAIKTEKFIRHGQPFIEIIQMAREENVDLIVTAVLGNHVVGHRGHDDDKRTGEPVEIRLGEELLAHLYFFGYLHLLLFIQLDLVDKLVQISLFQPLRQPDHVETSQVDENASNLLVDPPEHGIRNIVSVVAELEHGDLFSFRHDLS